MTYQEETTMSEQFDRDDWEDRYHGHADVHGHHPSPQLAAEAADLTPGTALDAGCGEGANAGWLAARGWRVTAVDIAAAALDLARERAAAQGKAVAERIDWVRADLTEWVPEQRRYDLVTAHYVHPATAGDSVFERLAAAVAPGGTLLVVDHAPSDGHGPHEPAAGTHVSAEQTAARLDPDAWDVIVAEERTRSAAGAHGHDTVIHDTVLRAVRRSSSH
jgi:SAM-dependent methyltransferase